MRLGVLGGSFNPVHSGHLRLAVEARELLELDRVDLIPASMPPHKIHGLLPFGLRCRLLRLAVADMPGLGVNLTEARRRGPSYTWDTLGAYRAEHPEARLFFLLGVPDFLTLPTWRHGLELSRKADLAVAARQGMAVQDVQDFIQRFWPGTPAPKTLCGAWGEILEWNLPEHGRIVLITPPFLDISSTMVRSYWNQGRDVRFLVPECVRMELHRKKNVIQRFWVHGP